MKCKCCGLFVPGNGFSHIWTMVIILQIILGTCILRVSSENLPADTVAEEFAQFPQYAFPHHRQTPNFRRQLSPHEQSEIFTDIQQNHRFQHALADPRSPTNSHQHPFTIQQQQQQQFQSNLHPHHQRQVFPQRPILNPAQQPIYSQETVFTTQQSHFAHPNLPTQQSPILLSLQQSPLSSPQFSNLFPQNQQLQPHNSQFQTQSPPGLFSLQNGPTSVPHTPVIFSQQRPSIETQDSPVFTPQSQLKQQLTSQQSSNTLNQQLNEPHSTLETITKDDEPTDIETKPDSPTKESEAEEITTDVKVVKGIPETDFTIEKSISDPIELQKVQLLEQQREKERREQLFKLQQEHAKLVREENERRIREREEEERRLEERFRKHQEQLKKIQEEKERRRKIQEEEERLRRIQEEKERKIKQEEEQRRLLQEEKERKQKQQEVERLKKIEEEKERQRKEEEEKLRIIEEYKEKERQQQQSSIASTVYVQPTQPTTVDDLKQLSPRPKARILEDALASIAPEGLLLQNERQNLYYQLKEVQQQQKNENGEKQHTEESQQVSSNKQRPENQILQSKTEQRRIQPSKLSQIEKQLQQKQLQEQLQKQFQLQLLQRQDLLRQLKLAVSNAATPTNEDQIAPGPIIIAGSNSTGPLFLANGQKIQIVQSPRQGRPLTDIVPRNRPVSSTTVSTTTQRPPRALFEELTKGVLPPGADFEVIRHKQDGGLEDVGKQIPQNLPEKKVTFVFLEEQADGSFKVKGVRGNNNEEKPGENTTSGGDVESIIKKIQEGDLKLPESPKNIQVSQTTVPNKATSLPPTRSSQQYVPQTTLNSFSSTSKPNSVIKTVSSNFNFQQHPNMEFLPSVTVEPHYNIDSTVNTASSSIKHTAPTELPTTHSNSPYSVEVHPRGPNNNVQTQQKINPVTPFPTITSFSPPQSPITTIVPQSKYSPASVSPYTTSPPKQQSRPKEPFLPTNPTYTNPSQPFPGLISTGNVKKTVFQSKEAPIPGIIYANPTQISPSTTKIAVPQTEHSPLLNHKQKEYQQNVEAPSLKNPTRVSAPPTQNIIKETEKVLPLEEESSEEYPKTVGSPSSLAHVLKKEGLFAMSRFIRESGLNNILNDTGPYTVFAPTDKAFRALLVQLGGPEKAEEKFKENPRLLSGLLLHHVIPGAFDLSSLQDEMTGVSLAGTQLRVNTYTSQDVEWNDVQVITINGARISRDKHDISIPQGVAHAVDRVMFPLPVGNVLQTLRSDREHRFTKFLRAVVASGLSDTFSGNKIYTVFAPTDRAFSVVDTDDLDELLTDREMARALVLRHTSPGTLYTAGMRFYQLKDSMEKGSTITLHKNNGQVKANTANVVTHNIPATNGVIHAIDGLL